MTRLASILGVATVATLVLLSGCESAVKTDYTAKLDGTWTASNLTVMHPGVPTGIPTTVTVVIADGAGVNTGTFQLTLAQTIALPVETTASGTVKAVSSSVLKVTLTEFTVPPKLISDGMDVDVTDLRGVEQTLGYNLMDDSLKVSGAILKVLGVTAADDAELEFTK